MPNIIKNNYCIYCKKTIKYYSNWIKHCKTKRHNKNVNLFENEPIQSQNEPIQSQNEPIQSQNEPKRAKTEPKRAKTEPKRANQEPEISQRFLCNEINNKYSCKFCNKIFKHQSSKTKHERYRCKQKNKKPQFEVIYPDSEEDISNDDEVFEYTEEEYNNEYNKLEKYIECVNCEEGEDTFYLIGFLQKTNYYKYGMTTIDYIKYIKYRYTDHGPLTIFLNIKCKDGILD